MRKSHIRSSRDLPPLWDCNFRLTRTAKLRRLIRGRKVICEKRDRYIHGPDVSVCKAGRTELNRGMVRRQWTVDHTRYSRSRYRMDGRRAERLKSGLWRGRFVKPLEWRRGKRLEETQPEGGSMNQKILEVRNAGRGVAARRWFTLAIVGLLAAFPLLADDLADVLERYGVDSVDWRSEGGFTTLHFAAAIDDAAAVRVLIEAGADVDARNDAGFTPLMVAAEKKVDTGIVSGLIKAGADVDVRNDRGATALMAAAGNENAAAVRTLIEAGADVDARSNSGTTALHHAARKNDTDIVAALIEAGADVDARNDAGYTALDYAAARGDAADVRALLQAAANESRNDLADVLQRYGADSVDWRRKTDGATPLHLAALSRDTAAIRTLIEAGADVNAVNGQGKTPLNLLAVFPAKENAAVVPVLIEAGADVNARDEGGNTPLHLAVFPANNAAVVRALIEAGADVNAERGGFTPLRFAAIWEDTDTDIVSALIEAGAVEDARRDTLMQATAVRPDSESPRSREETLRREFREWVFEPCVHVAATLMRARAKALQYVTRQEYIDLGKALNPDAFEQAAAQAAREVRGLSAEERKAGYPLALMVCIQGVYEQHQQLLDP